MSEFFHHVYSSLKGYTTLFLSKELFPCKEDLEVYSRAMAGNITEGLLMNSFLCGEFRCFSRIFNAGVDRFRRKRYAIHTVAVRLETLSKMAHVTPLSFMRNAFLQSGSDLQDLNEYSFPGIALKKEMFDSKFSGIGIDDITFVGASALYSLFISAAKGDQVSYIILNNMMDVVKIDRILNLIPRRDRDGFCFFYNYDGREVRNEGVYISLQPSWENKKLNVGTSRYVNLCTGKSRNVEVSDMDETITIDNLWNEQDPEKRAASLDNVKSYIRKQEMNTLVK